MEKAKFDRSMVVGSYRADAAKRKEMWHFRLCLLFFFFFPPVQKALCFSFLHSCLFLKPQFIAHLFKCFTNDQVLQLVSYPLNLYSTKIFSPISFIQQLTKQLWHLFYCFLKLLFFYHFVFMCVHLIPTQIISSLELRKLVRPPVLHLLVATQPLTPSTLFASI